ncbi:hypothetical protein [Paraglaciecola aestuariivivens]
MYAFIWESARKEVFYLCGNFSSGVKQASVIKQLDTANLAEYSQQSTETGSIITFSSKFNVNLFQCVIELDTNNQVVQATYL